MYKTRKKNEMATKYKFGVTNNETLKQYFTMGGASGEAGEDSSGGGSGGGGGGGSNGGGSSDGGSSGGIDSGDGVCGD